MRCLAILLVAAFSSGCIATWRRAEVESRLLREHYASAGLPIARERLKALHARLLATTEAGCASIVRPCRAQSRSDDVFCFAWGSEDGCFQAIEGGDGLQLHGLKENHSSAIERWLFKALDPSFAEVTNTAAAVANAEIEPEEKPPTDANSFWAALRGVVQVPQATIGAQLQGGFRRWLEPYLLLNVGGGYERTFGRVNAEQPSDAILFTARAEFSAFDGLAKSRLNLPVLSAYIGITGVLGVAPQASWSTRAYIGVSSIVPFSVELGYSVAAFTMGAPGQFYVAAGFGI